MPELEFRPDVGQRVAIEAFGGYHLVLAPPGCGKTQILAERIRWAHARQGVGYGDMLCLTFTNRAARGMVERIGECIADEGVDEVYVGNVHRFCAKFLFENGILSPAASVIDDDDAVSIVARCLDEDELQVAENGARRRTYFDVIHFAHLMEQIRAGHPRELRLHPESCNSNDVAALRGICRRERRPFDAAAMTGIYDNVDLYIDGGTDVEALATLHKMDIAHRYQRYKEQNALVDFEDLLLMAYDAMMGWAEDHPGEPGYRKYSWVQVDEVQDLNPLQLAIVDLLTATGSASQPFTVMYLGDGDQAIFSFMGARLSTLDHLRRRCGGNIHHLSTNHRSPRYLLNVFNDYARTILNIPAPLLPQATDDSVEVDAHPLRILRSNTLDTEFFDCARCAASLASQYPNETTAIIVNSNSDAQRVSDELKGAATKHFKVSGEDVFSSIEMKVLLAHLNILANEHSFMSWSRLMKGLHVFETYNYARNFTRSLLNHAMLPSDFLLYEDSTYVAEFSRACEACDIVVFDTETTGLDVLNDDIVQIAAVRMRRGRVVEGSEFNVFLQTHRAIPAMLGDIPNPIIAELQQHEQLTPVEGLQRFIDYVGDAVLLGHNVEYDYHILDNNLRRHLPQIKLSERCPRRFDSLKLIRLLHPHLKEYKLKHLLAVLHLAGENSHLADADVQATCSLVEYCWQKSIEVVARQREFMAQKRVKSRVQTLRRNYQQIYQQGLRRLYEPFAGDQAALVDEMQRVYNEWVALEILKPVDGFERIERYLASDMMEGQVGGMLAQQLGQHLLELNTLKEADLCNSRSLDDRIFVTTVHKAKGLEFDNVIVFDAVEDRYPSYFNRDSAEGMAEDARKFYVAITRAKRRLFIAQSLTRIDYHGQAKERRLTRFMNPVLKYFD